MTIIGSAVERKEPFFTKSGIDCLNEREKTIILMRFGLSGSGEYTQKEVADMMGISQSYISRLEKKIIDRLRREMLRQMQC